jgi:catechol 2,3-dioxygenase-like lactoylglutathione lyase family enzyme
VTIATGHVDHLRLTVADTEEARAFFCDVLGFQKLADLPSGVLLTNGSLVLGVGPAPQGGAEGDRFDENRVGLDHLSFAVPDRAALDAAAAEMDRRGVAHSEITELSDYGMVAMPFRGPADIALELTAPLT